MEPAPQSMTTDFIENLLTSFESRLEKIETVFTSSEAVSESSLTLMNDFHLSLQDLREQRTQLNTMLRENMAKSGSLRKNDYDIMMYDIFFLLNEKEKEAENQFVRYIDDQKAMVRFLRQGIFGINNTEHNDYKEKIKEFKRELDSILNSQHRRKEKAITKFLEFQEIHKKITDKLQKLIDQDLPVSCKDIKNVKKHLLEELV